MVLGLGPMRISDNAFWQCIFSLLSDPALEKYICLFQGLGWDGDCPWCVCNSKASLPPWASQGPFTAPWSYSCDGSWMGSPQPVGGSPRLLVDVSPEFTVCGQAHISLQTFSAGSMGSSAGGGVRRGWSDSPPSLAISWLCGKPLEQGPKPRRVSEAPSSLNLSSLEC